MSDTGPGEMSTLAAKKIAEQLTAIQQAQTKEEFRTEVLVKLEYLITEVGHIKERLDANEKKLGVVSSVVDDSKGTVNKILGGFIVAGALAGVAAGLAKLIEFFRGAP